MNEPNAREARPFWFGSFGDFEPHAACPTESDAIRSAESRESRTEEIMTGIVLKVNNGNKVDNTGQIYPASSQDIQIFDLNQTEFEAIAEDWVRRLACPPRGRSEGCQGLGEGGERDVDNTGQISYPARRPGFGFGRGGGGAVSRPLSIERLFSLCRSG